MRNRHRSLVRAINLVFAISAAVSASAGAADFPLGTYAAGAVKITFDDKGTVSLVQGDQVMVTGVFTISADQIMIVDDSGPMACPKQQGAYKWQYSGDSLTFKKMDDPCDGRAQDLAGQVWKRSN